MTTDPILNVDLWGGATKAVQPTLRQIDQQMRAVGAKKAATTGSQVLYNKSVQHGNGAEHFVQASSSGDGLMRGWDVSVTFYPNASSQPMVAHDERNVDLARVLNLMNNYGTKEGLFKLSPRAAQAARRAVAEKKIGTFSGGKAVDLLDVDLWGSG